jgi:hypothetical protein
MKNLTNLIVPFSFLSILLPCQAQTHSTQIKRLEAENYINAHAATKVANNKLSQNSGVSSFR